MREARSIVTACFAFAVFLIVYASVHPGSAHGRGSSPRFLRMEVEELRSGRNPERHTLSVPYFLVGKAFRFAALGAFHRELELQFDSDLDADSFKAVWSELKSSPDGTEVTRNHDGDTLRFSKEGQFVLLKVAKHSYHSSIGANESESSASSESEASENAEEKIEDDSPKSSNGEKPPAVPKAPAEPRIPVAPSVPPTPAPLTASTSDDSDDELTLRMPVRVVEAAIASERDFDASTLISEIATVNRGDLVDIRHHGRHGHDAHVRVWVE